MSGTTGGSRRSRAISARLSTAPARISTTASPASTRAAILNKRGAAVHLTGTHDCKREVCGPALAKDYYNVVGDSDDDDTATLPAVVVVTKSDVAARAVPSNRRPRRVRPATTPMIRRIDPLCLARAPHGPPAEQPRPGQTGRDKLGGIVSRSFSIESSAMMQVFYARWYVRVHGRNRKPWSSLYMDRRKSADELLGDDEIPSGISNSSHQAHVWERMLRCDFCLRVVSSGTTRVECVVCNIVVHAGCLRNATPTTAGKKRVVGSPVASSRDIDSRDSLPSRPQDSRRDSGLLQPSDFPGGVTIFENEHDESATEDGGVLDAGSGDSADDREGGGGCPRDEPATASRRTKWVCSHCLKEHLSSVKDNAAEAKRRRERARFILSKGGFRAGPGDPEYELAQHQTLLDGVTFLQALWRGLRARRENEALNHNHFRAWRLDVLGLDGLPASTRGHDAASAVTPLSPFPGASGAAETSSQPRSQQHRHPQEQDRQTPGQQQQQQSPRYRVVVTVIQDMAPVGIETSAPPVQLFRFETPILPASADPAPPPAAGSAILSAVNKSSGNSGNNISKKDKPRSSVLSTPSALIGRGCPASSVEFNSEIQSPTWIKGKSQTSARKQRTMTKAKRGRKQQTSKDDEGATAAEEVAPSYTFVGQAFAHLKADLCRGTSRSLSLALRPQYFPVSNLQMVMPDHLPEGVTIRARVRPLSHVTSKCGYVHVSCSPGRLKCPRQRTSRAFAVLAGGFLSLYSKACSQKSPKSRLELREASVWVKAEVMQVLVCLRTPDEMGRTNFQVHAETMVELNAWHSRLLLASAADETLRS